MLVRAARDQVPAGLLGKGFGTGSPGEAELGSISAGRPTFVMGRLNEACFPQAAAAPRICDSRVQSDGGVWPGGLWYFLHPRFSAASPQRSRRQPRSQLFVVSEVTALTAAS